MEQQKKSFEQSLSTLEKIVIKLEAGDIDLEESLKVFEEGVELFNFCQQELDKANVKINILSKNLKMVTGIDD